MSRIATVVALLMGMIAMSASAAAGHRVSVCHNRHSAECRSFRAMNAFGRYAERRWVVSDPGGGGLSCGGEAPRWRCTLSAEGPGGKLEGCSVTGTVVEVRPGNDAVRHVNASPICTKRKASK